MTPEIQKKSVPRSALLVEDDELIRDIVATYLAQLGFHVVEAENGSKAITLIENLENGPFDIVVTDLLMPGANGDTVVKIAQERGACERFLIISGFACDMPTLDPAVRGSSIYLEKPFTFKAFENKIELLDSSRS